MFKLIFDTALQASTLYKLFESKVVLNVRGTWYFLRGTWYFAQNRMLEVMDGSGEAQKLCIQYPLFALVRLELPINYLSGLKCAWTLVLLAWTVVFGPK